ncbi:hypothetical protein B9Z19DRAFT_1008012 [Tuber borchii]|uniref:Uncharacterized protein n=1 Tax=Tuber borchii TaxID=42251 RepID=A0A2T6ZBI6_TUBBO|nr:hypothetical protein B9Z19DRAFT_1008012 [Tuber borchii]
MPPVDRSGSRNTFIYASDNPDTVLGGLWVTPGITNANFYYMVKLFCVFSDTFELRDHNGQLIEEDENQLQEGNYYIATNCSVTLTEDVPLLRTDSGISGTRTISFREAVRARDPGCVITGRPALLGRYEGLDAAHIFPLAYEEYWIAHKYSDWIQYPPAQESYGSINSVQNGLLLDRTIHGFFDSYLLSINPYDNYKIVCFGPEPLFFNLPTRLNPLLLTNIGWPDDRLLAWHFRQAVLTNMKGDGEPCFEQDFPPGSDMMGEIMSGPKAGARMEFELFGRLNASGGWELKQR